MKPIISHFLIHSLAGFAFLLFVSAAPGQEAGDEEQAARRAAMVLRAGKLKLEYPGMPDRPGPMLSKSPVLRTNDPTRNELDGALWLWLDGHRPVAALTITYYAVRKWNYENVTFADDALLLRGRPTWTWQPQAAARTWVVLNDPVPEVPRARQLALRALPRQFEVSEVRRGERFPLRLVGQPIYSYVDQNTGLLDAALFVVSNGTNPEVIVQVEARADGEKPRWHVAFARLTAAEATVKLGDQELWKVPPIAVGEFDPNAGYYATNEVDRPEPIATPGPDR
jgi:hypothetical protein